MAEKVGVYSALQDLKFDAGSQLIRDRLYGIQTEFPGYEDQVEKVGQSLVRARTKLLIKDYEESDEALGPVRSKFKVTETFLADLSGIFAELNHEKLKERLVEVVKEVI